MIGKEIAGRYQIESKLGAGGMGTVYRAKDKQSKEIVAVKHLKPEMARPDLIERFQREGEALHKLNHPNIVKILASFEEDGNHYLVMDYVTGGDLKDLLEEGQLPIERILHIAIELADALTRAHRLDIIHRDLKPPNVLIAEDATPRLTDFGIARVSGKERMTDTDAIIGTIDYLAPEAFGKDGIDRRVDIWAFGIMLFEMLTGEVPFKAEGIMQKIMAISHDPVSDIEALRSDIPIALVDLIYRMLEKDRNTRIVSMRHVGASLEDILHGRVLHTPPETRFANPIADIFERPKHNLPAQTIEFVGREAELSELAKLLDDPKIRLVTIVAQGGMGKTRLALEATKSQIESFANGIYFVELAPLSDPDNIVSAIADATGYQFQSDKRDPKQQVLDFLANKTMLLLMDNFEHLLNGANLVTDILNAAPNVQILATSRQRLNQTGETVLNLSGMDFPKWETPDDAFEYAAVKLFMQSAKRVQPQFELTADNMDEVARICILVQGMPLGILLAASWLSMLSVEEIAAEIAQSISFLENDMSDLPERHRSIRVVFDYSWNLMTENERDVFIKLSVFRGGFTREAAQEVAGANLRTLMNLMNKSLLHRDAESGRFGIHELLRQYGESHLQVSNELDIIQNEHAGFYADFMSRQWPNLKSQHQAAAVKTINNDFDNVLLAWEYLGKAGRASELREFASSLYLYIDFRLSISWGLELFMKARQSLQSLPESKDRDISLGHIIGRQAWCLFALNQNEKGAVVAQEALSILQRYHCPEETILAFVSLAANEHNLRNFSRVKLAAENGMTVVESDEFPWAVSWCHEMLASAYLTILQDTDSAYYHAKQCFKLANDSFQTANALWIQTGIAIELENYSEARHLAQEAMAFYKSIPKLWGIGTMYAQLGYIAYLEADYHAASHFSIQAIHTFWEDNNIVQLAWPLILFADVLIKIDKQSTAVTLLSCILAPDFRHISKDAYERLNALQDEMSSEKYHSAYGRGKTLDLETVVGELLAEFGEDD